MDFTLKGSYDSNVKKWVSLYCKMLGLPVKSFNAMNKIKCVNYRGKEYPLASMRRYYIRNNHLWCWSIYTRCVNGKLETEYYVIRASDEIEDI